LRLHQNCKIGIKCLLLYLCMGGRTRVVKSGCILGNVEANCEIRLSQDRRTFRRRSFQESGLDSKKSADLRESDLDPQIQCSSSRITPSSPLNSRNLLPKSIFFYTKSSSVTPDRFLLHQIDFCYTRSISATPDRFLLHHIDFCYTRSISATP